MRNIIVLGLAWSLTDVASEMVYPLIPLFLTAALGARPPNTAIIPSPANSTTLPPRSRTTRETASV